MNQSRSPMSGPESVAAANEPPGAARAAQAAISAISQRISIQNEAPINPTRALPELLTRSLVASLDSGSQLFSRQQQRQQHNLNQQLQLSNLNPNLNINLNQQQRQQHFDHYQLQSAADQSSQQFNFDATLTTASQQPEQSFSDWWSDYWSRQPFPSGYTQSSITLLACLITTIIFLIVVGNLLVCIAIFTEKSLKPTQNWFIASLAVSDMLLGLVVMPFSLARELMGFWIFGPLWCDIHEAIDVLLTTASINTLCLISLDRYWSITQAVSYLKKRTPRRGAFMIAFVWIFSAAVSLPPLFGWKKQTTPITVTSNSTSSPSSQPKRTTIRPTTTVAPSWTPPEEYMNEQRARRAAIKPSSPTSARFRRNDELATPLMMIGRSQGHEYQQRQLPDMISSFEDRPEPTTLGTITPASSSTPVSLDQLPPITTSEQIEYPSCQLSDDVGYVLYSALGSFYIPCAVMVFTYIKIFLAARSRARRAINKQSRSHQQAAANKRLAAARRNNPQTTITSQQPGGQNNPSVLVHTGEVIAGGNKQTGSSAMEPLMRGKIVIVERKKSLSAAAAAASNGLDNKDKWTSSGLVDQPIKASAATYTCSDLVARSAAETSAEALLCSNLVKADHVGADHQHQTCLATITTSGAKQASASALGNATTANETANRDDENISVITVMNPSMAEVTVTQFNFGTCQPEQSTAREAANTRETPGSGAASESDEARRKATALLNAIREVSGQEELLREVLSSDSAQSGSSTDSTSGSTSPPSSSSASSASPTALSEEDGKQQAGRKLPDIVIKTRGSGAEDEDENGGAEAEGRPAQGAHCTTTNETCFMSIEEDSDMFEARAGRTVTIMAGKGINKQTGPKQQQQQSGQDIMMTALMQPVGNNQPQQQQLQLGHHANVVLCNNVICRQQRPQATKSGSSYCGSSMTINDDDIDECVVDDELLTDDCNGYSVSCGLDQYCPGDSTCPHCQECEREQQQSPDKAHSGGDQRQLQPHEKQQQLFQSNRHLSITHPKSPVRKVPQQQQQQHRLAESEAQSMTGDDNLSLTEYRSNDDSSSVIGHDVLDATESHKKSSSGDQTGRKKSSIGFRLARLGSSAPLSIQSGGLLALATSQQQQQQQLQQTSGGGTRNLKALRQNFFLKLNQLTAKSAAKSKRSDKASPTGKSSAHSSGTSYEPSVDCPTTSNIHSIDLHQETTAGEPEEDFDEHHNASGVDLGPRQHDVDQTTSARDNRTSASANQESEDDADNDELKAASNNRRSTGGSKSPLDSEQQQANTNNNRNHQKNEANNNTDKNDDDRALLLRSPSSQLLNGTSNLNLPSSGAGETGRDRRLLNASPTVASTAIRKQQKFDERGGTKSSSGSQMNRSSTMISSSAGTAGSSANRAYLASDNERHKRKLAKARERRATLILGLIMAAFICSWLPFFTFYVLRALCTVCREYMPPRFEAFIFWMGYCNSAINPIIYTIFNRDFRKAFRKILFKCL